LGKPEKLALDNLPFFAYEVDKRSLRLAGHAILNYNTKPE
jgi:hypothetical protein